MIDTNNLSTRIHIFKHLSIDEIDNSVNMSIFENLLNEYYNVFVHFCNNVKSDKDHIDTISCYLEEGELKFELKYKDDVSEDNKKKLIIPDGT